MEFLELKGIKFEKEGNAYCLFFCPFSACGALYMLQLLCADLPAKYPVVQAA